MGACLADELVAGGGHVRAAARTEAALAVAGSPAPRNLVLGEHHVRVARLGAVERVKLVVDARPCNLIVRRVGDDNLIDVLAANGSRTASAYASEACSSARVAACSALTARTSAARSAACSCCVAPSIVKAFFGSSVDDEASAARRSFIRGITELDAHAPLGLEGASKLVWPVAAARNAPPGLAAAGLSHVVRDGHVVQNGAVIFAVDGVGDALYIVEKGKLLHKGRLVGLHSDPTWIAFERNGAIM